MTSKIKFLTPEEIAAEEKEAAKLGVTIFQYRHIRKLRELRKERIQKKRKETLAKKRKEKQKEINRKKGVEKRRKTFEKRRKLKEKEELKEKKRLKKEKERQKKALQPKKKKIGRPKKSGPKINWYKRRKKKIEAEKRKLLPPKTVSWDYKIVRCKNGEQDAYLGKYDTVEKAYNKINELLKEEIIFPQKLKKKESVISELKYEYLILKVKTEEIPMLRNEYGKVVEQKTNSEKWDVYDKFSCDIEETFWVWGYDYKNDRKTFKWIYDNILIGSLESKYDIRRVILYKSKIVFLHDDETLDLVFCKSSEDAIRFYNKLEEFIEKDKIKQVFFVGSYNEISDKRKHLEEQLVKLTGWKKNKIQK